MNFADHLKAVRRRNGYTQAMAAELIPGLSLRTFQAWERSQQTPPVWAQNLVLDTLGGKTYQPPKKRKRPRASPGGR